jgi:hypothetical protein
VTVTSFHAQKVKVGTGRHVKRALGLSVGFSGSLDARAAENLAAYTVFAGKIPKGHKGAQPVYTRLVPLSQALYFDAAHTVVLLPRGKHTLPRLEQLHVNVSVLTDPMGRPINDGKDFTATVTHTGLVVSAASLPTAAAVDAPFAAGTVPSRLRSGESA